MGQLTASDNDQQDPEQRNRNLSHLLGGGWVGKPVKSIRRDPEPINPPNPQGPKSGTWIAETVD